MMVKVASGQGGVHQLNWECMLLCMRRTCTALDGCMAAAAAYLLLSEIITKNERILQGTFMLNNNQHTLELRLSNGGISEWWCKILMHSTEPLNLRCEMITTPFLTFNYKGIWRH